ncbi:protocatechuate 3,4-dioxygenase subunit alpha [Devosia sp. YIM 151766]|uniref:protocatechuate 3,4-dioxygenase subunit alpha n=1 Tax=Devosia sp. YIM 151766 TaxID=3017325 RepID=UPI00255D1649|nr:protocatechuate 3,4-dioxygenase subunit alpha [Devosia sp. YIM 151766]WIY53185.1 protocatechuate 3,4-dioxygenase subunit alpha [Devosia sp. YIM 151766]
MSLHPVPKLKESPSQTAGPYVHIGMTPNFCGITGVIDADPGSNMLSPEVKGERIVIAGRVIDGAGTPVTDAVLEIWQADAQGGLVAPMSPHSNSTPAFTGWGRQPTRADGSFSFETIKPGRVEGPDGKPMAPHVSLWIVARGINIGLQTRLYFADEAEANQEDYVLNKIMDPRRRDTLIARREEGAIPRYVLDIHLQGDRETVFFDI